MLRRLWAGALGVSLGLGSASRAGDLYYPPAALGPVAGPAEVATTSSAVGLGRPVPLAARPVVAPASLTFPDQPLRPTISHLAELAAPRPVMPAAVACYAAPVQPAALGVPRNATRGPGVQPCRWDDRSAIDANEIRVAPVPEDGAAPPPAVVAPFIDDSGCGVESADGSAGCCCPAACCNPQKCLWFDAEYLLWRLKNGNVPPLVTTSPAGTAPGMAGALGVGGTAVLFGGSTLQEGTFSGGRITVGCWFDPDNTVGLEASGFMLERRGIRFSASSDATGSPILARPFFNAVTGSEAASFVSFPGAFVGGISAESSTRLWGAGMDVVLRPPCLWNTKVLVGFRYLDLNESLGIVQQSSLLPGGVVPVFGTIVAPPAAVTFSDLFQTRDQFFGGNLGLQKDFYWGPFSLMVKTQVALGMTHEVVNIVGSKVLVTPAGVTTGPGGILALNSNSGRATKNEFTAVPEFETRISYQLTDCLKVFAGYNFLYWGNVVRPGDQVDRVINPARQADLTIGPSRPQMLFNKSDFWAQGVSFGVLLEY